MTATANIKTRCGIICTLELKNTKLVKFSPERPNVKLSVTKVTGEEHFVKIIEPILEKVKANGNLHKTIIYCSSFKLCGDVYMSLREKVKQDHFSVAMYHSQTLQHIKDDVLEDFVQAESYKYSIIIATSALGMGVNIPNVRYIFHYGSPSDIESYIQEIGRAGRDSLQSVAFLCYRSYDLATIRDEDLKFHIINSDKKCRRQLLMSLFNEESIGLEIGHLCCDVCSSKCKCDECKKVISHMEAIVCEEKKVREVSKNQRLTFKSALIEALHISEKFSADISSKLEFIDTEKYLSDFFGMEEFTSGITFNIIKEIFDEKSNDNNVFDGWSEKEVEDILSLEVISLEPNDSE